VPWVEVISASGGFRVCGEVLKRSPAEALLRAASDCCSPSNTAMRAKLFRETTRRPRIGASQQRIYIPGYKC